MSLFFLSCSFLRYPIKLGSGNFPRAVISFDLLVQEFLYHVVLKNAEIWPKHHPLSVSYADLRQLSKVWLEGEWKAKVENNDSGQFFRGLEKRSNVLFVVGRKKTSVEVMNHKTFIVLRAHKLSFWVDYMQNAPCNLSTQSSAVVNQPTSIGFSATSLSYTRWGSGRHSLPKLKWTCNLLH